MFLSYLFISLFFTFNHELKSIISKHFAVFFYYLTALSFINIVSTALVLQFAVIFTVLYIGWMIVNLVKISDKNFDFSHDKSGKLFIKTMLQFSLSLILLTIIIVLLIK